MYRMNLPRLAGVSTVVSLNCRRSWMVRRRRFTCAIFPAFTTPGLSHSVSAMSTQEDDESVQSWRIQNRLRGDENDRVRTVEAHR